MTTTAHKIAMLESFGFTVGARDERLNTDYTGAFMAVEATSADISDYELPTADGANGPWCVVGDDLDEVVERAFSDYLMSLASDDNKIDEEWARISALAEGELPARRFTSLEPEAAPTI